VIHSSLWLHFWPVIFSHLASCVFHAIWTSPHLRNLCAVESISPHLLHTALFARSPWKNLSPTRSVSVADLYFMSCIQVGIALCLVLLYTSATSDLNTFGSLHFCSQVRLASLPSLKVVGSYQSFATNLLYMSPVFRSPILFTLLPSMFPKIRSVISSLAAVLLLHHVACRIA
jgi:hypothetical protein